MIYQYLYIYYALENDPLCNEKKYLTSDSWTLSRNYRVDTIVLGKKV